MILDSSRDINRVEFLAQHPQIDLVIIHLTRDGKAVTWSYMKKYSKFLSYAWNWFAEDLKVEFLKEKIPVALMFLFVTKI
jgi:hypothetical protein